MSESREVASGAGSLPTPYYQDEAVTIYHGDCRELLSDVADSDALVTDPPYGISYSPAAGGRGWGGKGRGWGKTFTGRDLIRGDSEPFDPTPLVELSVPSVLWGANHYASRLPDAACWLVWDKREGLSRNTFADCELAWTNLPGTARLFHHRWDGVVRASERGVRLHPSQKPVTLMRWCLGLLPDAKLILDPYMGSGSTLRAAKDLGRQAVGIEIEERYCEIAAKRCAQEVLDLGRESEPAFPSGGSRPSQEAR